MYRLIGIVVIVHQMPGRAGFNPMPGHTKDSKRYLIPPCLTLGIIRYELGVSGAIQGKE